MAPTYDPEHSREIVDWRHLFHEPEGIEEDGDPKQNDLMLQKHFVLANSMWTGTIHVPSLNVRVPLDPNTFYLFKTVQDPQKSMALIDQVADVPFYHKDTKEANELGYYSRITYSDKGVKAKLNIILIRRGVTDLDRIVAESHENGHFIFTAKEEQIVYDSYRVPAKAQEKILTPEDFANFCKLMAMHNYLGTMEAVEQRLERYERTHMHKNPWIVELAKQVFRE